MGRKRIEERSLTPEVVASTDDEIERLTALLSTVIKVANVTKRELEKELGASGGYLSRLLSGKMGLSVRHILLICAAIGMEPAEFFHLAYPAAPAAGEGTGMARDILRRFQGLGYEPRSPGRPTSSSPISDDDLDQRIRASLGRALRELVSGEGVGMLGEVGGGVPLPSPVQATAVGVAPKRSTRGRR